MTTFQLRVFSRFRANELPRSNDCLRASVSFCSLDNLLVQCRLTSGQLQCNGASLSPSSFNEFTWIPLILTHSVTENKFYKRFTVFSTFWNLFILEFVVNFTNGHARNYSCIGGNFCLLFTWRQVTSARRV